MISVANRTFDSAESLEKLVFHLATLYRQGENCEDFEGAPVSDGEYDDMYRVLRQHKPKSIAFKGTDPGKEKTKGKIVVHKPPMTSIAKADGEYNEKLKLYNDWISDCASRLLFGTRSFELEEIVQSWKRDGNACRANYVKGELISAGTRPRDGINGTDVTGHMKYIKGIPQKLALPLTLSLNFEVECWKDDFQAINAERDAAGEEPYANSRNYVAGQMGRDDPEEIKNGKLRATVHSISGFDNWQDHYHTEIECAKWANSKDGLNLGCYVQVKSHRFEDLEKMEAEAPHLPYAVDGIVLKINDLEEQEQLGNHGDDPIKEPRGALAWKFAEKTAIAIADHIEWNASRTGRVVPKVIFKEAVELAETMVGRATCNNFGWAKDRGIGTGTQIEIKKAGKIIPNVVRVVDGAYDSNKFQYPDRCPSCDGDLVINTSDSGNQDLMCENPECAAKQIISWVFFFQNLGCKGLGASSMEKILASGKVRHLNDFYRLSICDLRRYGFSERQALLAMATIWMVDPNDVENEELEERIKDVSKHLLKVQGWKLFASLGIPQVGRTAGKTLIEHFGSMEGIMNASEEDLEAVGGIGPISAKSTYDYFRKNSTMVSDLLLRFELELPKQGDLSGQSFCLTGGFEEGKEHWHELIESRGGKAAKSVSKTTTYLVAGEKTGKTKMEAAKKLGVKVITATDLKTILE